ncbi:magnesium chelatase subunit I [Hydrogenophaga palleronii]|uniref:Magnesium chelatase subunit I n=1 Tax=Hydrogenophaga palleronii TaxID=65655 RepID=A0ABU1WHW0_9BURK|nr:AAA family ATPase [Hydrogenophaga palleronii]MDR7148672.1 magnesium chelatase subunit I [Hydrogenophaga palleronii]
MNTTVPELHAAASAAFPFTALVGHEPLQRALLLAAIDPGMGGVLISGPRGTAKSTSARALAALLPQAPFVTLPLAASLEQLVGTLNIEDVLRDGQVRLAPGMVARAHGGVLYVDEVNLLPDALVDALLDVAASGLNTVERDGVSRQHAARFVLVGTMNPEEGELRPQLLDRFGLSVTLENPVDAEQRQAIVRARLAFDHDPQALLARQAKKQALLVAAIMEGREALNDLHWPDAVVQHAAQLALTAGVDGIRADLVMLRAARALAALEQRGSVRVEDVDAVAELALAHRRSPDAAQPPANRPSPAPADGQRAAEQQPTSEGDWGALPPQSQGMVRFAATGVWPPKKA